MTVESIPGWRTIQLHEVCRPKQWQTIKKSEMTESGFPVYGANGQIGRYHSFNHANPTILIGCRGSCGAINVCEPNSWVTGNAMALEDLDTSRVDFNFMVYALKSDGLRDAITGTSQPQITQTSLKRIHLPLPPLEEQRRIAAVLDAAEALRGRRHHALVRVDSLTQAIFIDMFGDPSSSTLFPQASIGSVAEVVTGNTPSRAVASYYGDHIEWVKSDNITGSGEITSASERLSVLGRAKGREAPAGSTLIVCIAGSPSSIGRAGFLNREVAFNQQINAVLPGPLVLPEFVFHQLRLGQRMVQQASTNSMKGMVSKSALAAVQILVPPVDNQREFVESVRTIGEVRNTMSDSLAATEVLFASLQQRAFQGEL